MGVCYFYMLVKFIPQLNIAQLGGATFTWVYMVKVNLCFRETVHNRIISETTKFLPKLINLLPFSGTSFFFNNYKICYFKCPREIANKSFRKLHDSSLKRSERMWEQHQNKTMHQHHIAASSSLNVTQGKQQLTWWYETEANYSIHIADTNTLAHNYPPSGKYYSL